MNKYGHKDIIEEWENDIDKGHFQDYLQEIRDDSIAHDEITAKVKEIHREVFDEIDCLLCANCCKTTPPIYTNKDVKRIAAYLKIPPRTFKRKYTIEDVNGELIGIKVPCSFLNEDHTCQIYEVRPEACRRYPHTDEEDFVLRASLNYQNTLVCPAAYAIVKRLMI